MVRGMEFLTRNRGPSVPPPPKPTPIFMLADPLPLRHSRSVSVTEVPEVMVLMELLPG